MDVRKYISDNIHKTFRLNKQSNGTLIGLPYSYVVPSMKDCFNELYYWDTYFTNKGLILLGYIDYAKNNVLNILHLIEKYGYMPNGNRTYLLKRSQPPYAAMMVDDVFRKTHDLNFLKTAFPILKKEYSFWMKERIAKNGLNRYGTFEDEDGCVEFFHRHVKSRVAVDLTKDIVETGRHYLAEAESGWDFTARFSGRCIDHNPVDLNSNLYVYEKLFAEYEILLQEGDGSAWIEQANARAKKINELLWDEKEKVYKDYNYTTETFSPVISAASFQPYFAGIADKQKSEYLLTLLAKLEGDFGVFATRFTSNTENKYQWGYPNVWAPCQCIAYIALQNYNFSEEAKRIAKKYIQLIELNFDRYGGLFEKYNGFTGDIDAIAEYGTPEMLGWTAGVYLFSLNILKDERS